MSDALTDRRAPGWVTDLFLAGSPHTGHGEPLAVYNPATEEVLASVPQATVDQVDAAVTAARAAFDTGIWSRMDGAERGKLLHAFADELERMHSDLAAGVVCEVGSPVTLATSLQTTTAINVLRVYADLAARDRTEDLGDDIGSVSSHSIVAYRPMGVVAVITAYNVPLLILARAMGAALAAGCTTVVLPSPKAPLTTLLVARAAAAAGIPAGVINVVVGGQDVGERLGTHPDIDKVAFTGSLGVGRAIMAQASRSLTRLSLELGGKSPSLVLPGVDLAPLVFDLHARYLRNGGQGCAAPTRILVPQESYDEFVGASRSAMAAIKTGDPWDADTIVGPLIRREHRDGVQAQVEAAVADGARIEARGPAPTTDRGWYLSPVLVGGVGPDAAIAQNELFGPVGVVLPYRDLDDAILQANATEFGLSANVYCPDVTEGIEIAARLRSGSVAINGGGAFRPDAPFGGFKKSGFGREYGDWGVREFLEVQHIQWTI